MKKLLLISLLSVGLFSCSSDDDNATPASLNGKWAMEKSYIIFNNEIINDQTEIHVHNCSSSKDYIQFNENTTTGLEREYYESCNSYDDDFTYTVNGNNVMMNFDEYEWDATIYEITNEVLKLQDNTASGFGRIFEYKKIN
nr:lipocalin family protein [uncultured Flavobacterium sp.]